MHRGERPRPFLNRSNRFSPTRPFVRREFGRFRAARRCRLRDTRGRSGPAILVQQAPLLKAGYRPTDLALGDPRTVAHLDLCQPGRFDDGFEDSPLVVREDVQNPMSHGFGRLWAVRLLRRGVGRVARVGRFRRVARPVGCGSLVGSSRECPTPDERVHTADDAGDDETHQDGADEGHRWNGVPVHRAAGQVHLHRTDDAQQQNAHDQDSGGDIGLLSFHDDSLTVRIQGLPVTFSGSRPLSRLYRSVWRAYRRLSVAGRGGSSMVVRPSRR